MRLTFASGDCPRARIGRRTYAQTRRTVRETRVSRRASVSILINPTSHNRRDSFPFECPSIKGRIAAFGSRFFHIECPVALRVKHGEVGVAAFENTPRLHLHDSL